MSVTISEYCLTNDNVLVKCLKKALDDGIFLYDTLIEVILRNDDWWCEFYMNYTLSCNDLAAFADTFSGYWWCVSPYYGEERYRVSVNLRNEKL